MCEARKMNRVDMDMEADMELDFAQVDMEEQDEEEISKEVEEVANCSVYSEDGVAAYLKEIRNYKILTKDEVSQLIKEMREGNMQAKNRIIEHNLKLAFSVAKKYAGRGVPLLDLVQEANLGLVKAVEKFDPQMGYAFSTYALWWTTATVRRYLQDYGGNIKIPTYINERISKVDRVIKAIEAEGEVATPEEIAATLDVPVEEVQHTIRSKNIASVLSLDFSPDESDPLSNIIADDGQNVEDSFIKSESARILVEIVKKTCKSEREADILLRSFGFYGDKNTLEEIGELYGITKERVRQIKDKALKRFQGIISGEIKSKKKGESDIKVEDIRKILVALRD